MRSILSVRFRQIVSNLEKHCAGMLGLSTLRTARNCTGSRTSFAEPPKGNDMTQSTDLSRLSQYQPYLLAALRIVAGVLFLSHGLAKLIGFPVAPPGIQPLTSLFGVGAVIETVTGILIILGLFTRPAAFLAAGQMAVAYWMFHAPQNLYPAANGGDAAILFCFVFLYLVVAGPGAFSLESAIRSSPSGAAPLVSRSRS
jgi:putative oxidoreductase